MFMGYTAITWYLVFLWKWLIMKMWSLWISAQRMVQESASYRRDYRAVVSYTAYLDLLRGFCWVALAFLDHHRHWKCLMFMYHIPHLLFYDMEPQYLNLITWMCTLSFIFVHGLTSCGHWVCWYINSAFLWLIFIPNASEDFDID